MKNSFEFFVVPLSFLDSGENESEEINTTIHCFYFTLNLSSIDSYEHFFNALI